MPEQELDQGARAGALRRVHQGATCVPAGQAVSGLSARRRPTHVSGSEVILWIVAIAVLLIFCLCLANPAAVQAAADLHCNQDGRSVPAGSGLRVRGMRAIAGCRRVAQRIVEGKQEVVKPVGCLGRCRVAKFLEGRAAVFEQLLPGRPPRFPPRRSRFPGFPSEQPGWLVQSHHACLSSRPRRRIRRPGHLLRGVEKLCERCTCLGFDAAFAVSVPVGDEPGQSLPPLRRGSGGPANRSVRWNPRLEAGCSRRWDCSHRAWGPAVERRAF